MMRCRLPMFSLLVVLLMSIANASASQATGTTQIMLPLVVQAPAPVRVLSHTSVGLGTGSVVVVGEVLNELATPIYLVNVTVRFYDQANQQVASDSVLTTLIQTAHNQRNPFRLLVNPAPTSAVRYDLSLTWSFQNRSDYRPITILSPKVRDTNGLRIDGVARNEQKRGLRTGKVVATFYAADGTVVDTAASIIGKSYLGSGDRYPFTIWAGHPTTFASFVVQAEGYVKP